MRKTPFVLTALAFLTCLSFPAFAAGPPCRPCSGLLVDDPDTAYEALAEAPAIVPDGRLYVAWDVDLAEIDTTGAGAVRAVTRLESLGVHPWLRFVFRTPAPLAQNLDALEAEMETAATLARSLAADREGRLPSHFQVLWQGAGSEGNVADYAFLYKRAAVALSGADTSARILPRALPADETTLRAFYAEEVSAYLDGVVIAAPSPGGSGDEDLTPTMELLTELDPGRPVVVEGLPFPAEPARALARAAEAARQGAAVALFRLPRPTPEQMAALPVLSNEFLGDLSFDPYSVPTGGEGAWVFVRGEDLGLRVLVEAPAGTDELTLTFPDPQLRSPARVDPATGEAIPLAGVRRTASGLVVRVADPEPVTVLRLDRMSAEEMAALEGVQGLDEQVTITDERQMPVEEILRRLQTFEDAQQRKLDHYRATNRTSLRFQAAAGAGGGFEATLEGPFFFRQGEGYDWAWSNFYVNGVRWKGRELPEIPLIQPEKAATMPLTIELSRRYTYRLAGSDTVRGRECWVVEFRPVGDAVAEEENLFRGTVWVDKEIFARVQTRAVQLGLEGEVLSNEETVSFSPLTADGEPASWSPDAYFLPVRTVGQQILSIINTATVLDREVVLSDIRINGPSFEEDRTATLDSELTMVRDTPAGMRYLVVDEESGERVVKEGFDASKTFLLGGVFYDDSLDYPLPLAGINYLSLDFRGTGAQVNAFFGGALGTLDYAQPRFLGSRFDVGVDAFVFAVPTGDELYRDGREVIAEEVESQTGNISFLAGHPIGNFAKITAEYELTYDKYGRAEDTADAFVLPEDGFTHQGKLGLRFARSGWQMDLEGSYNKRQSWEPWGIPGASEYDPEQEDYLLWEARVLKNWYLPKFQRFSAEVDYFGGRDLDRFSKYGFGFFGSTRVHGYRSGRVRAEEGYAAHLTYGFRVGELFRLEGVVDGAWVTDDRTGLDNELLAGVGLVGQFIGPWNTLIQIDLGTPVAGPDDGFVAYVVFLKLFN